MCWYNLNYGLIVAVIALIGTFAGIRYQILILINTQLSNKAKECNSYLGSNYAVGAVFKPSKISGIVSAIITAQQLLNYHFKYKKYYILFGASKNRAKTQFYLQLHTSIREFLEREELNVAQFEGGSEHGKQVICRQFLMCKEILKNSIKKNKINKFDKLI